MPHPRRPSVTHTHSAAVALVPLDTTTSSSHSSKPDIPLSSDAELESDPPSTPPHHIPQNHLAILLSLISSSIIGVALRLGLISLHTYTPTPINPITYPNFVGCVIMGWAAAHRDQWQRAYYPLWTWWTTGLCGSLTTFSSWIVAAGKVMFGLEGAPGGGNNFLAGLAILLFGLASSLSGIALGRHLALIPLLSPSAWHRDRTHTRDIILVPEGYDPTRLFRPPRRRWDLVNLFCAVAGLCVVAAVALGTTVGREVGLSMLIGPLGTLLRFHLSTLNPRRPHFPVGTLLANFIGTAVLSATTASRLSGALAGSEWGCAVVGAVGDGFCGCLTTISTLCLELFTISAYAPESSEATRKRAVGRAYVYGGVSVMGGMLIALAVLGGPWWGRSREWTGGC
ncbi:hypothetical protein M427DRAFT_440442 [Gonapodya prolifera JEL478]|uniref:CRCB-domain-containing protein n=1 Tax=Gonapodya prolifera (strain JEL478) TaxID=1344416 RepID=A0A139A392_GONPJ|nr:hypothetical protein M427DRAFT_440442 [Gonapodya prolifera JEL478]|eukprot:KXS11262.1 hypothetical protein M427DRAFT_440442 [Gonapodya prolifera JEL478]